ncbi:hypothetical protein J4Q44_G00228150 [Coregonus suidteri]|uniref:Uncharacterized protein n=1 Tax=Coregonus suidteri TaxID=861788 RepID=A0AAN8LFX8_9TELE
MLMCNIPVLNELLSISPTMVFTDEEEVWLERISSEVPDCDELTALEGQLSQMAKPCSPFEALIFQISASIQFGLTSLHSAVPLAPEAGTKHSHKRAVVSSQCR